jgi:hypothetical protein
MYHYFRKTDFLKQQLMIPFNEAMCYGDTSSELFSEEFIQIRSNVHRVTIEQYREITISTLEPLFRLHFTNLMLWFDADMFCQINLLTILAWLDKMKYKGTVVLQLVGDCFEPKEQYHIEAKGYYQVFHQVLLDKTKPDVDIPPPLEKGIELYLEYPKKDSKLMTYIEMNKHIPEKDLLSALIENFKEYGLGDTQYLELIRS